MILTMGGSPFCSHGAPWPPCSCPRYLHANSDSSSCTLLHLPLETRPGYTWTHLSVTSFLSLNPSQYESSHHKQDWLITASNIFHFLVQIYIVKSCNFDFNSACDFKFQTLPHTILFSIACVRSKGSLFITAVTQEYFEFILLFRSVH